MARRRAGLYEASDEDENDDWEGLYGGGGDEDGEGGDEEVRMTMVEV